MLAVFDSEPHSVSPNSAHAADAETRDRGVRRMTPESAEGLWGPRRWRLELYSIILVSATHRGYHY